MTQTSADSGVSAVLKPRLSSRRWWRATGALFSLTLTLFGALVFYGVYLAADLPDLNNFRLGEGPRMVIVTDRNGQEIGRRGGQGARPVALSSLPAYLPAAVLAIEDRRFYQHHGVELRGTMRALIANFRAGHVVQGGSTLTQQLAKNLFLDSERSLNRKAREAMLAVWLDATYDKHQLLQAYLNEVYFGGGAWGVEAAARRYFGKSASEVSLAEAALLAGLLKAPNQFSPVNDTRRAEARANVVLDVMLQSGSIDQAAYNQARATPVRVLPRGKRETGGHFVDLVVDEAQRHGGPHTRQLTVRTTLDLSMQEAAERAVLAQLKDTPLEAAVVAIEGDGAVRVMVGGRDYRASQFNRAVAARRQAGSMFKPFVYLSAVEAGISPVDLRVDEPIELDGYSPANFDLKYRGAVPINRALADSVNIVAVKLAEEVGRERVANTAERLGLAKKVRPHRSMALGTIDVTPIDAAEGYLPFANQGFRVPSYSITEITDESGKVLYARSRNEPRRVIEDRPLRQITELMAGVVEEGTGRAARLEEREVAGKTGTSNDHRDGWFAGYVPGLVAVVWVGRDDNLPHENLVGGREPARIWQAFMQRAIAGAPVQPLYRDRSVGLGQTSAMLYAALPDYDSQALTTVLETGTVPTPVAASASPPGGWLYPPEPISPEPSVPNPAPSTGMQPAPLPDAVPASREYSRGELDALIDAVEQASTEGLEIGGPLEDEPAMDRDKLSAISAIVSN